MTQVTPPPSPKNNGEDVVVKSETWSSRLRNNQTRSCSGVVFTSRDLRRKARSRIPQLTSTPKTPVVVFHHNEDSNCSHNSIDSISVRNQQFNSLFLKCNFLNLLQAPSPVCNGRMRTRQSSGESPTSASYWPRRSNRLIGIPAETVESEETSKKDQTNGHSLSHDEEEEPEAAVALNGQEECGNCKQHQRKKRNIDKLLEEGEHFMHYPASPTSRSRSTYNSQQRVGSSASVEHVQSPSPERPPQPPPAPLGPLPDTVHQVKFSFEMVPSGTIWYQTFLRDEQEQQLPPTTIHQEPDQPAPFLLPYEMTLETILKSNKPVRKKTIGTKRKRGESVAPSFRPIISTRLQMQAAAAAAAATCSSSSSSDEASKKRHRRPGKPPNSRWMLPRKSPRCHASTMAILCSKSDDDEAAATAAVTEEPQEDTELVRLLKEMLTQGLDRRPVDEQQQEEPQPAARKRGRPRKYPRPESPPPVQPPPQQQHKTDAPLVHLLDTPLDRIGDIVDERLLQSPDETMELSFSDDNLPVFASSSILEQQEDNSIFHDLEESSSSVYETASEVGSTSTGTCGSANSSEIRRRHRHTNGSHHRRKRPNMTGWPRSKKPRRPALLTLEDDLPIGGNGGGTTDEDDDDFGPPPVLTPIREESSIDVAIPRSSSCGSNSNGYVRNKPFQFQRKTLRFVGKRILRPAAQRSAPQRLQYWPCFPSNSKSSGGSGGGPRSGRKPRA